MEQKEAQVKQKEEIELKATASIGTDFRGPPPPPSNVFERWFKQLYILLRTQAILTVIFSKLKFKTHIN